MNKQVSRRHFMKLTVGALSALLMVTRGRQKRVQAATSDSGDEAFVIWNGWVLKKTDLKHIA